MKTAAKVFTILTMVFTFFLIYPIVLGIITLNKLENAKTAKELTTIGIIDIFFMGTITGVLIILIKDEDLRENREKHFLEEEDEYYIDDEY